MASVVTFAPPYILTPLPPCHLLPSKFIHNALVKGEIKTYPPPQKETLFKLSLTIYFQCISISRKDIPVPLIDQLLKT
jgi:hypothetical protein